MNKAKEIAYAKGETPKTLQDLYPILTKENTGVPLSYFKSVATRNIITLGDKNTRTTITPKQLRK